MIDPRSWRKLLNKVYGAERFPNFEQKRASSLAWRKKAENLGAGADACEAAGVDVSVVCFLRGLSLEVMAKAVIASKGLPIVETHILTKLFDGAGLAIDEDEAAILHYLTESVVWLGRYPVPKKEEHYDAFHDDRMEALTIREQSTGHRSVRLNPRRNPRDVGSIWKKLLDAYVEPS